MYAPTITLVKDGGFFGHPQSDMWNVGYGVHRMTVFRAASILKSPWGRELEDAVDAGESPP